MLVCQPLTSRPGTPGGVPLVAALTVIAGVIVAAVLVVEAVVVVEPAAGVEAVGVAGMVGAGAAGWGGVETADGSNSRIVEPIEWLRARFIVARLGSTFGPEAPGDALGLGAGGGLGVGVDVEVVTGVVSACTGATAPPARTTAPDIARVAIVANVTKERE
jgi:hypothetical protein